jgi:small conductance mechanosensitive channel
MVVPSFEREADMTEYMEPIKDWLLHSGVEILIIVVGSFIAIRILKVIIRRSKDRIGAPEKVGIERSKRTETLAGLVETTARVVVLVFALLMVLKEIGIDIGPLLAGAGIVGLAVGFGAQSLVKDVISGFFILLENHMNVGDVVQIAGQAGLVESVNLRVTVLRDLEGRVHVVPNGEIAVVTNMTKEWSRAVLDIGVAYKEDVDAVIAILREVGEELRADPQFADRILEPLEILGLDRFDNSAVVIKAFFKTLPREQWNVVREFNRRIKRAFDERGIEIPFPHLTLYMGEGESTGKLSVEVTGGGSR